MGSKKSKKVKINVPKPRKIKSKKDTILFTRSEFFQTKE